MREKKKTEIATNVSSGAEKVEEIKEKVEESKTAAGNAKKTVTEVKKKAEDAAAEKRVQAALKKEEKRKARAERRKAEEEAFLREYAHRKANRIQERQRRRAERNKAVEKRRENKGSHGERRKSNGGWIAAVVALGAVNLALTTAVTIGAIEMKKGAEMLTAGYKGTMYELMGIMENVDSDLDRARISNTPVQQDRILTDLLVQARLAELDLEKLPISAEADRNVTAFINRVAAVSEKMLSKLRHGQPLTKADEETLQKLYETNRGLREQLNGFMEKVQDKDIMSYVKKGEGMLTQTIEGLEKLTLEENGDLMKGEMKGAGKERTAPESGNTPKMDPAQAEEICKKYFSDYKVEDFQCVGETVNGNLGAYNVQGYDDKGTQLFAEIDWNKGQLLRFDYYEDCQGENFDVDNARMIAENFVEKLGYSDMIVARVRENGGISDFSFVYGEDGVRCYPDEIRVKVCRSRGIVSGFDGSRYAKNHKERELPENTLNLAKAQAQLKSGVEVESSDLAIVQTARGERAAYEFLCSYQDERYFIYVDATTGEEISIVNVKNLG